MNYVKHLFGFLMLAVAIYFLERIIPSVCASLLYATLALAFALWIFSSKVTHQGIKVLTQTVAIIAFIYGAQNFWSFFASFQALNGQVNLNNESRQNQAAKANNFIKIESREALKAALAQNNGKAFMLDFTAAWCVTCKEMEHYTFPDASVQALFQQMNVLQIDVTDNTEEQRALLKHFDLFGPPAILFFDAQGNEITAYRNFGFVEKAQFAQHLQRAIAYKAP